MRNGTRLTLATMVAFVLMLPVAALGTEANGDRQWTVLMYFGADNDLYQATEFGMNQALKGLEEAGADSGEIAVVVLIDGPDNKDTMVFELTAGGPVDKTMDALGESSGNIEKTMTDPETLLEFLVWGMDVYEAQKTMLVLKNGHAWCGICPDETNNQGNEKYLMPIDEVRYAIGEAYEELVPLREVRPWIDAIVFDADNMGSIEVAYELREVTDYFVASQQQVPLEGFPYYLFMKHLAWSDDEVDPDMGPDMGVEEACIQLTKDYVTYYNNTKGSKPLYDKLLANSQMYVTAAVLSMGAQDDDRDLSQGWKMQAVVDRFNDCLNYMLTGEVPQAIWDEALSEGVPLENLTRTLSQWEYPADSGTWALIPLNHNNIASARDCALIGKMNDQQGYEWLPDVYTWLWSMSALTNYEAYGDPDPPSEDVDLTSLPALDELYDPIVRLLFEHFMDAFGYIEPGIYRGIWDEQCLTGEGALVWVSQSQILDRSGNSFPHGLNIWFPPSPLQWDEDDEWSDLFNKPMTYAYSGIGVWIGIEVVMPAEYYCIDCPEMYQDIGLEFTESTVTSWLQFFDVYYDSRWLIYGTDTGSKLKP